MTTTTNGNVSMFSAFEPVPDDTAVRVDGGGLFGDIVGAVGILVESVGEVTLSGTTIAAGRAISK